MAEVIWDWLRLLAFAEAAFIWGLTLAIFRLYHSRYRFALNAGTAGRRHGERRTGERAEPRGFDTPWIGLIPRYVWLVTVGTLILVACTCGLVIRGLGHAPAVWWGLPGALMGFTILGIGLTSLARYEYRLVH